MVIAQRVRPVVTKSTRRILRCAVASDDVSVDAMTHIISGAASCLRKVVYKCVIVEGWCARGRASVCACVGARGRRNNGRFAAAVRRRQRRVSRAAGSFGERSTVADSCILLRRNRIIEHNRRARNRRSKCSLLMYNNTLLYIQCYTHNPYYYFNLNTMHYYYYITMFTISIAFKLNYETKCKTIL